ncbi:MAG TPA: hypothetical protein VKE95_03590 [Burkholderiales bacterium]|nr:hypothetical protein [Burkholderiales bacterium]
MLDKTSLAIGAIALTTIAGCDTAPRVGQSASVDFGIVKSAQPVQLNSTAGQGALIGGTAGLLLGGPGNRPGAAIAGAALGGIAGGVAGGDRTGMQFTVALASGSSVRVVTDQREIRVGDCVAVERVGQGANIRRVSAQHCEPAYARVVQTAEVNGAAKAAAIRCEEAKQELAEATTIEAAELAIRKIELLCN